MFKSVIIWIIQRKCQALNPNSRSRTIFCRTMIIDGIYQLEKSVQVCFFYDISWGGDVGGKSFLKRIFEGFRNVANIFYQIQNKIFYGFAILRLRFLLYVYLIRRTLVVLLLSVSLKLRIHMPIAYACAYTENIKIQR